MDIYISKSKGVMECTFTCPGSDTLCAISETTVVITNVNKSKPDNTISSDLSRFHKNGTNPTQVKTGIYKLTAARAPSTGNGKYGTGKQGLVIGFSQMLEVTDPTKDNVGEKVQDGGYMIHITPWKYTDGCTGIPYDQNNSKSKEKAENIINHLVDIYENTMSEKGDKQAYVHIMD